MLPTAACSIPAAFSSGLTRRPPGSVDPPRPDQATPGPATGAATPPPPRGPASSHAARRARTPSPHPRVALGVHLRLPALTLHPLVLIPLGGQLLVELLRFAPWHRPAVVPVWDGLQPIAIIRRQIVSSTWPVRTATKAIGIIGSVGTSSVRRATVGSFRLSRYAPRVRRRVIRRASRPGRAARADRVSGELRRLDAARRAARAPPPRL
jgi:hypothetical protein